MTYSSTTPQSTDPINTTYTPIATNFSILDTTFNTDHVPPTDAVSANWGKHKQLTMQVSASAPAPSGTDSSWYSKTVSGVQQAFFKNAAGTETQLTGIRSIGTNGYSLLPGGVIMQWGISTISGALTTVSFPLTFPTAVYSITMTPLKTGSSQNNTQTIQTVTTSSFKYNFATGTGVTQLYWMAIGS